VRAKRDSEPQPELQGKGEDNDPFGVQEESEVKKLSELLTAREKTVPGRLSYGIVCIEKTLNSV